MPAIAWWRRITVSRLPASTSRPTASSSRSPAPRESARSMRRRRPGRRRQRSPMAGSGRSPPKFSAEWFGARALAGVAALLLASAAGAGDSRLVPYEIVGDAIPQSLTGGKGDPLRGRAIVVNRQAGLCLLCHTGPFAEERLPGSIAPDLAGVGTRLTVGQLRLRIVDASRVNPNTIMPPYYTN